MGKQKFLIIALLIFYFINVISVSAAESDNDESESGSGDDDENEMSFSDIINLSIRQIVTSNDAKKDGEILDKYYFTDKKKMSIWPKIIEETENVTNSEFEERELADMENSIKNIYRRMLECDLNNAAQKKKKKKEKDLVKCYKTLGEFIADGFVDFSLPRGTMQGHAHMFEMNVAYNVMVLLIYHMISSMSIKAQLNSFSTQIQFYKIAEGFVESMEIVSASSIDVRLGSVSLIEICEIQEVLWQEFSGFCETRDTARVKRDADLIHGIGGSSNVFGQKYRATVTDDVTGDDICYEEANAKTAKSASKIKDDLTKTCAKQRENYISKLKKEITEYYNERSAAVTKELPKLWGSDKAKLAHVKEELDNRQKKDKKKIAGKKEN